MTMKKFLDALIEQTDTGPLSKQDVLELHKAYYNPFTRGVLEACSRKGVPALANDNIYGMIDFGELEQAAVEVEAAYQELLSTLMINYKEDHNSENTPQRYAKMALYETFHGRYSQPPELSHFPNVHSADTLQIHKGIRIESVCSHHHQNIRGHATIGVLPKPDGKHMGLSKFTRIARHYARRPQIQEELTVQIAEHINNAIDPKGVIVVIEAEHQCMGVRGVHEHDARTRTVHLIGEFKTELALREEFYSNLRPIG